MAKHDFEIQIGDWRQSKDQKQSTVDSSTVLSTVRVVSRNLEINSRTSTDSTDRR